MVQRWPRPVVRLFLALAFLGTAPKGSADEAPAKKPFTRTTEVRQLLEARCVSCHGGKKTRGGLDLTTREALLRGGDSGPVVVPGQAGKSRLYKLVLHAEEPGMPQKGDRLSAAQADLIAAWIDAGVPYERPLVGRAIPKSQAWWAYNPIRKPTPPAVSSPEYRNWAEGPIDQFVLAKLVEKGLTPAPPADRRTLLRRVTFDLVGLPPTPEELDAFLHDPDPDAFEKVVDRLLASPHYGERWARHWMDVIHFAETHGHDQDVPRENAWPYRDYLIRSLNADKPYGRLVEEQIAGDILYPEDPQATVALGFLAAGPWDESSLRDIREDTLDRKAGQYLDRDDMVGTVGLSLLSTTVQCARCHDHKFDPISQEEYYGLQAIFAGVDRADRPYDADPKVRARRLALLKRQAELKDGKEKEKVKAELAALPPSQMVYAAAADFVPQGSFRPAGGCRPVQVLKRGDIRQPGGSAVPEALSCIPGLEGHFHLDNLKSEGARRAAFAHWVSDPRNPLTWRSAVNRVWQHHFGRGLVATPSDFGHMGARPTHPELLDWLAATFLEEGGSLKKLHRRIVTSATYRQSSRHHAEFAKRDGDNLYLWRMTRTRLDAESLHDAVLQVSGKLDPTMGGPSVRHFLQSPGIHRTPKVDYLGFNPDSPGGHRRSVYRFVFRTLPDPFMDALDCPDASQFTAVRANSVTVLQALAMLNDQFMVRMSEHFAERLAPAGCVEEQVRRAYLLALGREATSQETMALAGYARRHGMANACRLLFNCNEFLFVP
jgi:mono/diheme cytochrome c family protein